MLLLRAVTYEPPGKTGLQELQYLDNISRPKVSLEASLLLELPD